MKLGLSFQDAYSTLLPVNYRTPELICPGEALAKSDWLQSVFITTSD